MRPDKKTEALRWREIEKQLHAAGWSRRQARVEVARLKRREEHERQQHATA
jgi:hypothetical protein